MARLRSTAYIIVILGAVLLFGIAAGVIVGRQFDRPAILLSEEFRHPSLFLSQGRPMMHIFWATDRVASEAKTPQQTFKAGRESADHLGVADVEIPSGRRMGDRIQEDQIRDFRSMPPDRFFDELAQAAARPGIRCVCISIHGYGVSFAKAVVQTARFEFDLNLPIIPVCYSWASQGNAWAYETDRQMAEDSGKDFARFLQKLRAHLPDGVKINIIAHSLGARLVCHAFDKLQEDPDWMDPAAEIDNVILVAPNVDQHAFNQGFKHEIQRMANHLTVYVASNDRMLLLAQAAFGDKPLTITNSDETELDETLSILALTSDAPPNIELVDASYVTHADFGHHLYQLVPAVLSDLHWLLKDNPHAANRNLLQSARPGQSNAWILPPQ